jgi:hypothetical protein
VSLVADIIQLVGTGSVPVVVAGSVLGVFELGERLASQRAKDALSKWLLSFDIQKARALPDGTQELFERIFGERHFSLKCFIRSSAFSLGAVSFIAILLLLVDPKQFKHGVMVVPDEGVFSPFSPLMSFLFWLPWSIVIDYVSLFKTRFILRIFTRVRRINAKAAIPIMVIDYVGYTVIFSIGVTLITLGTLGIARGLEGKNGWSVLVGGFPFIILGHAIDAFFIPPRLADVYTMFFWAGLAPSIWMWLYVAALFVTLAFLRSEKLINWLRWFLDVEKNPFRSIGAVAAALAFIVSVVIILVSAEVSRISAAASSAR